MGAFGPAIFSDDVACDVRDAYKQLVAEGYAGQDATVKLTTEWLQDVKENDPDVLVFWLALAATQSSMGLLEGQVRDRALSIIDSGQDLERWREVGKEPQRQAVLSKLREQLLGPQPEAKQPRSTRTTRSPAAIAIRSIRDAGGYLNGPKTKPHSLTFSSSNQVSDTLLDLLSVLTELEHLAVENTRQVTPMGIQSICRLIRLKSLHLSKGSFESEALEHLRDLDNLEALALTEMLLDDLAVESLAAMKRLRYLDLSITNVTDCGCEYIARLGNIETLGLEHTSVTNCGIALLARLPRLRELRLAGTKVDDGLFASLLALPALEAVALQRTKVTQQGRRLFRSQRIRVQVHL